jgi:muramoyltetrapeptide carboxypeptidase LdcA involved in peptidoglycan recycling
MGYSDTTTMLTYFNLLGLVTFNGPSVMAGFSQAENLPKEFTQHVYDILFKSSPIYEYPFFGSYCEGYLDFSSDKNIGKTKPLVKDTGMRTIQGKGIVSGQLFGGCLEVLEFLKSTDFYPPQDFWSNKILFFETSEQKPSIDSIKFILRNYGVQGIFDKINGLIFARARNYSEKEKEELDNVIREVICVEFDNPSLGIVTNAEFGHTDPQIILPNGIMIQINLDDANLKLIENCVEN